jgi:PKD repeat protein
MKYKLQLLILISLFILKNAYPQVLKEVLTGIPGLSYGCSACGDFNNDGYVDILIAGISNSGTITKVYKNNGNATFTDINAGLPGISSGSVNWGDFNNDNYLDILITGNGISSVYKNNGGTSFTLISTGLMGLYDSYAAWGDYNNDGFLDIILTGSTALNSGDLKSVIYKNNGNNTFTDIKANLAGEAYGSATWVDYDKDGDLDLHLSRSSDIYRNDGNNVFTAVKANVAGAYDGYSPWGDYDNDGDLDILNMEDILNNNNGIFSKINAGITRVWGYGSSAWGDYDNDGDLDFLVTGAGESTPVTKMYKNNGSGEFTEAYFMDLPVVIYSDVSFFDFNNDQKLDILISGTDINGNRLTKLFQNNLDITNSKPSVPSNLTFNYSTLNFNWDAASDNETPQKSLQYNIRVGTSPGGYNKLSPMALSDGKRLIYQTGNAGLNTQFYLSLDTNITYYWNVQTIDNQMSASAWTSNKSLALKGHPTIFISSTESDSTNNSHIPVLFTFSHPVINFDISDITVTNGVIKEFTEVKSGLVWSAKINPVSEGKITIKVSKGKVQKMDGKGNLESNLLSFRFYFLTRVNTGFGTLTNSSVTWGDYDNNGLMDVLLTGDNGTKKITKIYRNNGNESFSDINAGLFGYSSGNALWGDYDNDGFLDILVFGLDERGYDYSSFKIYHNNTKGLFEEVSTNINFKGIYSTSANWSDYDNDGDLDILLSGKISLMGNEDEVTNLYRNDGNNIFTDIKAGLIGLANSASAWGDYDNDGDLDLIISGFSTTRSEGITYSIRTSKVYRNNGNGIFTEINSGIKGVFNSSAEWGDYDADGDLDILLTGNASDGRISEIYRNNGDDTFSNIKAGLMGIENGTGTWGDYDNDGDLDVLLTGSGISKIYRNDGKDKFTDINTSMKGVTSGSSGWCDYDEDGDQDIIVTGSGDVSIIYKNHLPLNNTLPNQPDNLIFDSAKFLFSWNPSSDKETKLEALSYNIRIGTTSGGCNIVAPNALGTGKRTINGYGNTGQSHDFKYDFKSNNTYFWSVQAIDHQWAASNWYASKTFTIADYSSVKITTPVDTINSPTFQVTITFSDQVGEFDISDIKVFDGEVQALTQVKTGIEWQATIRAIAKQVSVQIPSNSVRNLKGKSNFASNIVKVYLQVFSGTNVDSDMGPIIWGDYNNDGYLDIFKAGCYYKCGPLIYKNNGNKTFTSISLGISFQLIKSAAWGDYDNDNDLDILLAGVDNVGPTTSIYRNDNGVFTKINAGLISSTSVAWGDYDNDGNLDIAANNRIYRNSGNDIFSDIKAGIDSIDFGSESWGDFDHDGDLDLVITGGRVEPYWDLISRIYRNDGNGTFTDIKAGLPGVKYSSVAWGDYNNDGELDLLITGQQEDLSNISKIYRNNGDQTFTEINANLKGVCYSSSSWGDYDNDGDLDILITGSTGNEYSSIIYRNEGNGTFIVTDAGLLAVWSGSSGWGDYDNDGDLDVILSGKRYDVQRFNRLYENHLFNQKSEVKLSNFSSHMQKYMAVLEWQPDNNIQSCTFNVKVGVVPGGEEIIKSGTVKNISMQIPKLGNAQSATKFKFDLQKIIDHIPSNSIYWSVQTIGNNFRPNSWSAPQELPINVIADFSADSVCQGKPTSFTDLSFGSFFDMWIWEYGDGKIDTITNSDLKNPKHIYPQGGIYNVKLTVFSGSVANAMTKSIRVYNKPIANFSVDPVCAGNDASFVNLSQTASIVIGKWYWDFGDGSNSTQTGNISHKYALPDTAKLLIISDKGCSDSIQKPVTVASYPIAVVTSNTPLSFCMGDSVTLSVSNNPSYLYTWKIDGSNLTGGVSSRYTAKFTGNYTVEVINPVASCKTTSSAVNVSVQSAPSPPSISASGPVQFCQGDSVTLTVSNISGYVYQWKLNGGAVGTNSSKFVAKSPGSYNLIVSNSNECSVSSVNSFNVLVNSLPSTSSVSLSGPTTFCSGGKITLSIPSTSGHTYNWRDETGLITGANSNSFIVDKSGSYQVDISNSSGCTVKTPPVNVIVKPTPTKPVIDPGNYQAGKCMGEVPIKLSVSQAVTGYSYQWYKNGIPMSNETSSSYEAFLSQGDYSIEADLSGCKVQSDLLNVYFENAPEKPLIYAEGSNIWYLACSNDSASQYKWYYNGSLIQGADKYIYVANRKLGRYNVSIANAKGCFTISDPVMIPTGTTGIDDVDPFAGLKIYPNPTPGLFTIEMDNQLFGDLLINILTQEGKSILRIRFEKTTVHFSSQIDLSGQPKGMYLINILINKYLANRKIVVE